MGLIYFQPAPITRLPLRFGSGQPDESLEDIVLSRLLAQAGYGDDHLDLIATQIIDTAEQRGMELQPNAEINVRSILRTLDLGSLAKRIREASLMLGITSLDDDSSF